MAGLDIKDEIKMRLNQKKSQVTMLIIVGLLLFIVVSLVLYLAKSAVSKKTKDTVKKTQETSLETQPIKEFVAKCLDKLAKEAVVLLGKQGGIIYKSQSGTAVDYRSTGEGAFFVKVEEPNKDEFNVAYNIIPPVYEKTVKNIQNYPNVPNYPWIKFPYDESDTTLNSQVFEGNFGTSLMPPLNASGGPHSFQVQIESYIDSNMVKCANFNVFKNQGIDIVMKNPNTAVVLGNNDISVKSNIPMKITNSKTKEFSELNDFSANLNIRLKDFYFYTKDLINKDVNNIEFNMAGSANNKDGFRVKVIKNVNDPTKVKADLVIVTDDKSLISGKPLEYRFARKNRAPALYYIKGAENLEFEEDYMIRDEDLLGNPLQKQAIDPDEDQLNIRIKALLSDPNYRKMDSPQITFRVEVDDGVLVDYQDITVRRKGTN